MLKYGNKDLRKRWIGNVNIANIHLGTTKIWPYITSTSVGDWVVTATPSKTTVSAAGETITITVTGKRTTTYTWVNFIGTTTERYTTTADETISNYTISSSIGTVNGNKVTIPYNPNTSDRNITITVNVSGQTVTKTIVQTKNVVTYSAWQLSASSNVSSVASSGGTATITASSWRTYTNSNGQPGGTQNGTISYNPSVGSMSGNIWNIPANSSADSRNVTLTVTGSGNLTKTINISQAADNPITYTEEQIGEYSDLAAGYTSNSPLSPIGWKRTYSDGTIEYYYVTAATATQGTVNAGSNGNAVWNGEANVSSGNKLIRIEGKNGARVGYWEFTHLITGVTDAKWTVRRQLGKIIVQGSELADIQGIFINVTVTYANTEETVNVSVPINRGESYKEVAYEDIVGATYQGHSATVYPTHGALHEYKIDIAI